MLRRKERGFRVRVIRELDHYLSVEIESKAWIIIYISIAEQYSLSAWRSFDVLHQNIVDNWIDIVIDILEEYRKAILYSQLKMTQEI